jgi:hypothetical protein
MVMVFPRNRDFSPQNEFMNWFGTMNVRKQWPQVIAHLRKREVFRMSQGCHTCNRTTRHPVVKRPAVQCQQVPLMVFIVGQVKSGHGRLALREV